MANNSELTQPVNLDDQVWPRVRAAVTLADAQVPVLAQWASGLTTDQQVFLPEHVGGEIAFQALLLDGALDLERPGVGVYPNEPSTPLLRALTCFIPPSYDLALGRRTAAWVHTGKYPPSVIDVLYPPTSFVRSLPVPAVFARANVPAADLIQVGTTSVTTALRTVVDLAAWCTPPQATKHILTFSDSDTLIRQAKEYLNAHASFRNKIPALKLLTELS